ncbi:MAG: hypothetical protein AAGE52_01990 [Myxococcota bacterium]
MNGLRERAARARIDLFRVGFTALLLIFSLVLVAGARTTRFLGALYLELELPGEAPDDYYAAPLVLHVQRAGRGKASVSHGYRHLATIPGNDLPGIEHWVDILGHTHVRLDVDDEVDVQALVAVIDALTTQDIEVTVNMRTLLAP